MTVIILAGGKSSRMGFDKAFIELGGISIIKRQLKLLKTIFTKTIIVTNDPARYNLKNVVVVPDITAGCGPLAGIYSGLRRSDSFYNFVVACDMPFLQEAPIRAIIQQKDGYDVVIPRIDRKYHPLFGLYSRRCIPVIEKMMAQNRLNVSSIFPVVRSRFISKQEMKKTDRNLTTLVNINTKSELRRWQKTMAKDAKGAV